MTMFGAPAPCTSSKSGPSPPPPVRIDEAIIARARASRWGQSTRNLCEIANDMSNSLQDAQEQLARKRAKVHSLTQDKEQLIKEKADLMEQNRTLRSEVAHLTQLLESLHVSRLAACEQ